MCQNRRQVSEIKVKFSNILLGLGVGLFAGNAIALSLGEAHGRVLLGRPLDLIFDIDTDPGTELDVACVKAFGQAGDTRIDSSRLRVTAQPVVAGRPPSVRIHSSMVVVEPILTLRLTVGCSGAMSRSYDFFADVPAEVKASDLPLVIAPSVAPLEAAKDKDVAVRAPVEETPKPAKPPPKPPTPPKAVKPPKAAKPPTQPAPAPIDEAVIASESVAVPAQHPRLKVEPLGDWSAESAALRLPPNLEQVLQEGPKDVEQTQARLQQQQVELDAARASYAKMQTELSVLQQRIALLDSQRPSTTLMYFLVGLLLLACVLVGWLWQRLRGQTTVQHAELDWNYLATLHAKDFAGTPSNPEPSGLPPLESAFSHAVEKDIEPTPTPTPTSAPVLDARPTESLDLPLITPAALPALAAAVRMLHPEELFDLQQQADFFVSVGEHDQAIEVMKKHIDENETASPLMYLELLRLYHSLSRRDDFKLLRAQFQQHFNALVPEFPAFNAVGRSLLDYPEAAASIEAVWSDATVLPLLESYIFCRKDGHPPVERFDLPAYDDLLLLYAVANTTPAKARGAPPPRQRTTPYADAVIVPTPELSPDLEPLPSLAQEDPLARDLLSSAQLPPVDASMDLDLDLELFMGIDKSIAAPTGLDLEPEPSQPPLSNLIEYDSRFLTDKAMAGPDTQPAPAPVSEESPWMLDLDLSEPDFFGVDLSPSPQDDVPALPATPAPTPGQAIGFGTSSDRFEARFDLEEDDISRKR